jgi:hypothetical protein
MLPLCLTGAANRASAQPRNTRTMPISQLSLSLPTTHWPVWSDSTTATVRFMAMPKKIAVKLRHRASDFDRQARHGGEIGHAGLQVLHTLVFEFLNFRTGRLDLSYAAIARKADVCERMVAAALQRLKSLGAFEGDTTQAEALPPDVLAQIVRAAIAQCVDDTGYETVLAAEADARARLSRRLRLPLRDLDGVR